MENNKLKNYEKNIISPIFSSTYGGSPCYEKSTVLADTTCQRWAHVCGPQTEVLRAALEDEATYQLLGKAHSANSPSTRRLEGRMVRENGRLGEPSFGFQGNETYQLISREHVSEGSSEALTFLHSASYALSHLKDTFESWGIGFEDLVYKAQCYGMVYLISQYFECVRKPQSGDIVHYVQSSNDYVGVYNPGLEGTYTFRKGGTVKGRPFPATQISKALTVTTYEHDFFFLPLCHGNRAEFYRLKTTKPQALLMLPLKLALIEASLGSLSYRFTESLKTRAKRVCIDKLVNPQSLVRAVFFARYLPVKTNCFLKCYDYAFYTLYGSQANVEWKGCQKLTHQQMLKYFDAIPYEKAKEKDLVCYYEESIHWKDPNADALPLHYGVYEGGGWVSSKWGSQGVFTHGLEEVSTRYGAYITFYRKKRELSQKNVSNARNEL